MVRAVIAFVAYALGVFAGGAVAARRVSLAAGDTRRLRAAIACLTGETALLMAMWGSWLVVYRETAGLGQIPPLALAGLAMGMQSAAMRSLGRPGLATTYLTGATTTLVSGIGGGGWRTRFDGVQALALAGVVIGAGVATRLGRHLSWIGPLPALLLVGGSVLFVRSHPRAGDTAEHDAPHNHEPGQHDSPSGTRAGALDVVGSPRADRGDAAEEERTEFLPRHETFWL